MVRIAHTLGAVLLAAVLPFGVVNAATLTFELDTSFGNVGDPGTESPPDALKPWLTVVFDDEGSAGSVKLTMTVAGDALAGVDPDLFDIAEVYFNLDPNLGDTYLGDLTFERTGGTGPTEDDTTINHTPTATDDYQADGDGVYDIQFVFPPPPGGQEKRFNAGEELVYLISDGGANLLTASSFNFWSEDSSNPLSTNGPYRVAAKVQDTGDGQLNSDWITTVPIPPAAWLFGSALGLLGWMRRHAASKNIA